MYMYNDLKYKPQDDLIYKPQATQLCLNNLIYLSCISLWAAGRFWASVMYDFMCFDILLLLV